MDNLLDDKESAKRRKNVADIKKMWEIYREHVQAGHIRVTDSIEDEPSTPVRIQRSDSPASRHRPPSFELPAVPSCSENFDASPSDMSRLATSPAASRQLEDEDEPSMPVTIRSSSPDSARQVGPSVGGGATSTPGGGWAWIVHILGDESVGHHLRTITRAVLGLAGCRATVFHADVVVFSGAEFGDFWRGGWGRGPVLGGE